MFFEDIKTALCRADWMRYGDSSFISVLSARSSTLPKR